MADIITPEQTKAARALLAWSQQELAGFAKVSPSTIADFERGFRTPMPNNAQAIREALEARGLQFVAGGVVAKTLLAPPPLPPRPGALMRWVNAANLSEWGGRWDGQSGMGELLRRLIYAAKGPSADVLFPSDESVHFPGWDGACTVAGGDNFIPDGISRWEIGAQRSGVRSKATNDYAKRSANPQGVDPKQTTFVFATPQRFPSKDAWIAERRAEQTWRDVRVIDADLLVHWLETYPAVAQWLAVRIGRRPKGLRNLEEAWAEWVRATILPLIEEIILTDRDDEGTAVLKWLRDPPSLLSVQAEAPDEAIAFLYAAISPLPEAHRLSYWSRCVIAVDNETARDLVGIGSPLIIVLSDPEPGLAQRLVDDGHHVYSAHGPDVAILAVGRRLARPWRHNLQMALRRAGFDDENAHRLARNSGRSITVLRRLMPAAPNYKPAWANIAPPELLAAMLAGGWLETSKLDQKVLSDIAGCPYEKLEQTLAPLAAALDGPLVRSGPAWKVVSLRDLWMLLASQLTQSQTERFESAFQQVLGAVNPRFDLKPEDTWFEREGQFGEEASAYLRRGLSEAMIALSVYPEAAASITQPAARADRSVQKLLGGADTRLWWSLCHDFQRLAEASPIAFLDAVDTALDGDIPPLMSLFRSDEGFIVPTEYLSRLLWSLEMLARSPDYLMHAALLLARLDSIDPGGKWGNRPAASLRKIFVTWSPQTYASPEQRLKVVDAIARRHPATGWNLLISLAPRHYDTSDHSPFPDWRDFTPDEQETITWPAVWEAAREIGARLIDHVGDDGKRWKELLGLWANFDADWRGEAVKRLAAFARGLQDQSEIEGLRDHLRDFLQRHRGFADAKWALPETELKPLDDVFQSLQPTGARERHRWLFGPNPNFLRPNVPFEVLEAERAGQQRIAAKELIAELAIEELLDFAQTVTLRFNLGYAIGEAEVEEDEKDRVLKASLLAEGDEYGNLCMGLLFGLLAKRGPSFVDHVWESAVAGGWGDHAELLIVKALPIGPATWSRIVARSPSLDRAYWTTLNVPAIPRGADLDQVTAKLIEAGRGRDAVDLLGSRLAEKPSGDALVQACRAAVKDGSAQASSDTMFTFFLGQILDRLEADQLASDAEIAAIEWSYFQVLRYSQRSPRTLQKALALDPAFFADLIKLVYRPDEASGIDEPNETNDPAAITRAQQAYAVLDNWSRVPGSDDLGRIDGKKLEAWVKRARKLCAEAGRGEIGDQKIGEILSAANPSPGGIWPPEPVCELIDTARSRALETGFEIGTRNRRGVTVRAPFDGGAQEREQAEHYHKAAEALRFEWMRTAACLDRIAESYEHDAQRMDEGAEQRDW
jgi:hypothetical protein